MKILFHSNQLALRGTEIALYDYAYYNELYFHNVSVVATKRAGNHHPGVMEKFTKQFKVIFYDDLAELEQFAIDDKIDIFYAIKSGENDGVILQNAKNCIHAVFKHRDFHGDVYAYVSEWLSKEMTGGQKPYVPHIIDLPKVDGNLRLQLGIPDEALVFGRYGGEDTFDLPFVKRLIYEIAKKREDIYFLFMNTDNFLQKKVFFRKRWVNKIVSPILFPEDKMNNVIF